MTPEVKQRIEQIRQGIVPEGYQKTIFGIAPMDWCMSRISEISKLSSGSTPRRDNTDNFDGDILWITSGELKQRNILDTRERISEAAAQSSHLEMYNPGTVVIAIYGLEAEGIRGTASIIGKRCTISQACMAFTELKDIDNEFFYYWYINNGQIIGLRYAQGTKQQNLSTDIVGAFPICYPRRSNQRKIAEILSTQDKAIELQGRKIEELKKFKKGCLEKMFPRKGQKVPEKRFSGFTGDWEQRKFGEVFEEYSEKYHSELPVLTIVQGRGTIRRDESDRNLLYDKSNLSNYKVVNEGDFIVHLRSFEGGLEIATNTGIISPAYHTFHGANTDSRFYYSYFRSKRFIDIDLKPHVYGIRDGRSIDIEGMKTIKIPSPNYEEQKAIGTYIRNLDSLITLHQRKLEEMKKQKKALMQLLLTGIVRVKP